MKTSSGGIEFIKQREGCFLQAYQDSVGIWTIGYGTIVYENHIPVRKGDSIRQEVADQLLLWQIGLKEEAVNHALIGTEVNQKQFDALVSFAYNVGIHSFLSSSLLSELKLNPNDPVIRSEFLRWDKGYVNNKLVVVQGLLNRRTAEAEMYFSVNS